MKRETFKDLEAFQKRVTELTARRYWTFADPENGDYWIEYEPTTTPADCQCGKEKE